VVLETTPAFCTTGLLVVVLIDGPKSSQLRGTSTIYRYNRYLPPVYQVPSQTYYCISSQLSSLRRSLTTDIPGNFFQSSAPNRPFICTSYWYILLIMDSTNCTSTSHGNLPPVVTRLPVACYYYVAAVVPEPCHNHAPRFTTIPTYHDAVVLWDLYGCTTDSFESQ